MKKSFIPLLAIAAALSTGCNPKGIDGNSVTPAPVVDKADAVAVVNGQYIAKSELEDLEKEVAERSHGQKIPKDKLVEELIQRQLLIQDALQKQLDKSPEVIKQFEVVKKTLLTNADIQNFVKANPITDAEIKAEYDEQVGKNKRTEYKARHILVKTEKEAKDRIAELDKGADFAKLANKYSVDPSAKESQNGGDLGWFPPEQMVPPFSEAVKALEKGKYTKTPVKTQFGWHVILREDSRDQTPPPLEAVKDQLKPFLQRKKIQGMLETMRKQAKVEILVPLEDEKPKAETPAAAAPAAEEKAPDAAGAEKTGTEQAKPAEKSASEATEKTAEPATEPAAKPAEPAAAAEKAVETAKTEATPAKP